MAARKKDQKGQLDQRERLFVAEYLIDLNAERAALAAGYSKSMAHTKAFQWVRRGKNSKPHVIAAIDERQNAIAEKCEITAEKVLERWWAIANADPNEIVQYRRVNCRYCHGEGHRYQWNDEAEYEAACAKAIANTPEGKQPVIPSKAGGFGFNERNDPHAECPRCNGEGYGEVHINDTRKLKGPAKLLYDGAKQTKDGIEVKLIDRSKALENVAKHLGMFKERVEHTGKDGGPIETKEVMIVKVPTKIAAIVETRELPKDNGRD